MSEIIGVVLGAGVVFGCVRLLDAERRNAPAWLVLAGGVWGTVQSAVELVRYLSSP